MAGEEVVLAHGITKEDKLPKADIERARKRKLRFEAHPIAHSHYEDLPDD